MMFRRTDGLVALLLVVCLAASDAQAQLGSLAIGRAKVSAVLNVEPLRPGQQAVVAVVADIPRGFHAVSHLKTDSNAPFEVTVTADPKARAFAPIYPPGHDETYPLLGTLNVYTGQVVTYVPLLVSADAPPGPFTLAGSVMVQMCNDRVCFPPASIPFVVKSDIVGLGGTTTAPAAAPTAAATTGVVSTPPIDPARRAELFKGFDPAVFSTLLSAPETSPLEPGGASGRDPSAANDAQAGKSFSLIGSILTALAAGLILNVMPCVLPVLPLKAMGFYQSAGHSRARSLLFGTAFAAGIVAAFGGLAVLVVGFQQSWGELFSYGWFIWTLVAVLVVFGLVQITGLSVPLPAGLYGVTFAHDSIVGNFNFGLFTAVLSTPCTGPFLGGLLLVAVTQNPAVGAIVIMTVGVGMALPYLVLSGFPNLARKFPRTGPWAEVVKQTMGCLLIAVAVYFAALRLMGGDRFWWPVFAAVAASSLFLVVRTAMLMPRTRPIAIAAVVALLLAGSSLAVTLRLTDSTGQWIAYTDDAFAAAAKAGGDVVLVKFTANWCANCKYIEGTVFHDDATLKALHDRGVRLIKADLTNRDAPGWPLLKRLSSSGGIPLTAIYTTGKPDPAVLESIYTATTLLQTIDASRGVAVR